jgi:uncharacterized membrane protein (DUF441 family)
VKSVQDPIVTGQVRLVPIGDFTESVAAIEVVVFWSIWGGDGLAVNMSGQYVCVGIWNKLGYYTSAYPIVMGWEA